jgi:dCMP deaminase
MNHQYFLNLAKAVSTGSKDQSTQVGAVIIGPNKEIRSTGFNGFPIGVNDLAGERHLRPTKYKFTEHAERNAIFLAARHGTPLDGCSLYCTLPPCADCARAIIQAGIKKVYFLQSKDAGFTERWCADSLPMYEMFHEAHVQIQPLFDSPVKNANGQDLGPGQVAYHAKLRFLLMLEQEEGVIICSDLKEEILLSVPPSELMVTSIYPKAEHMQMYSRWISGKIFEVAEQEANGST